VLSHMPPRHHAASVVGLPTRTKTAHSAHFPWAGASRGRMMMKRNVLLGVLIALLGATTAEAETFPSRPVTMYVTSAAGGWCVGPKRSARWGEPVVMENKGGAAHILGAQAVARGAPDGHTLLVGESAVFVLNHWLYGQDKLGYEVGKDLTPITGLVRIYQGIA